MSFLKYFAVDILVDVADGLMVSSLLPSLIITTWISKPNLTHLLVQQRNNEPNIKKIIDGNYIKKSVKTTKCRGSNLIGILK